jgi:hypothetical protein
MKKIIGLLSFVLLMNFTIAKAQTNTPTTDTKKEVVGTTSTPACHGKTADADHQCSDSKAKGTSTSATLSDNHSNAGSSTEKKEKSCSSSSDKSCCKHNSKASALGKTKGAKASSEATPQAPAAVPQQ